MVTDVNIVCEMPSIIEINAVCKWQPSKKISKIFYLSQNAIISHLSLRIGTQGKNKGDWSCQLIYFYDGKLTTSNRFPSI